MCMGGKRHSRSFLCLACDPLCHPQGWMALIHASLMAADPRDVGVTEEEEAAHPECVHLRGNWVVGMDGPPWTFSSFQLIQWVSCKNADSAGFRK